MSQGSCGALGAATGWAARRQELVWKRSFVSFLLRGIPEIDSTRRLAVLFQVNAHRVFHVKTARIEFMLVVASAIASSNFGVKKYRSMINK